MKTFILTALIGMCALVGCQSQEKFLKVAATPVPHADLLEAIKTDLEKEGVNLKIVEVDDYNLPNRLLFEKQVDANFFQHGPFLGEQNQRFGYSLIPLAAVHLEPLGLYSQKIVSLDSLKEGGIVAIPSDPSNEARALGLLQEVGLIKLKQKTVGPFSTIYDIEENPKHLKIEEVDAAFLPRALPDVDLAVIPSNFALQAHLNPSRDALALESSDSPYANLIAVREGDEDRDDLIALKKAMTSEKMRRYIQEKYKGAILPAF
jgi:D-methionine transport system substrate-binding protein